MKKPLIITLFILLVLLLSSTRLSYLPLGAAPASDCGNDICEASEDANNCPDDCDPVCGNDVLEEDEQCDGIDDAACPELCMSNCECTPPPNEWRWMFDKISATDVTTINFNEKGLAFQSLSFSFSEYVRTATFVLDAMEPQPKSFLPPDGVIYEYFSLVLENESQEDLLNYAEIFFKIPNKWLQDNNIRSVTLYRLGRVGWENINITQLRQDDWAIYWHGMISELGTFAAVGYTLTQPKPKHPVCGNGILEENETSATCCADAGCPSGLNCVAHVCQEANICGNGVCESAETIESCPIDCAKKLFGPNTASYLVAATAAIIAFLLLLGKKAFRKPSKPKRMKHVSPERWS